MPCKCLQPCHGSDFGLFLDNFAVLDLECFRCFLPTSNIIQYWQLNSIFSALSASWIAKFICDCRFTSLWALVKKNHTISNDLNMWWSSQHAVSTSRGQTKTVFKFETPSLSWLARISCSIKTHQTRLAVRSSISKCCCKRSSAYNIIQIHSILWKFVFQCRTLASRSWPSILTQILECHQCVYQKWKGTNAIWFLFVLFLFRLSFSFQACTWTVIWECVWNVGCVRPASWYACEAPRLWGWFVWVVVGACLWNPCETWCFCGRGFTEVFVWWCDVVFVSHGFFWFSYIHYTFNTYEYIWHT